MTQSYKKISSKETKRLTTNTLNTRRRCKYCGQEDKLRQCPTYCKRCDKCSKLNHFKQVCRGARASAVNTIEKETVYEQEPCIKTVNINSVSSNYNHFTIIANLKTSSNKTSIVIPYKIDMGSVGNIMLFNIFTELFPGTTADQLVATEDATKLRIHNHATIYTVR